MILLTVIAGGCASDRTQLAPAFKADLIRKLDPPDGCQAVQEEGQGRVSGFAGGSARLPRSMTPELERNLPRILEEDIEALDGFAAEAEVCATG
ncbi:MAG TPA: hypothetical protein VN522_02660 [Solirubrobacterales bacterium]|nr:hypothetical protein [Solirubrobacterales bacterium]